MGYAKGESVIGTANLEDSAVTLPKMAQLGTSGQVLTSNGTSSDPSYQTPSTVDLTAVETSIISDTDNTDDLGTAAKAWKDLYLAGGLYVGGTTSANFLDDYETGTWTPTIGASTSQSGQAYSNQSGSYVKSGDMVCCVFQVILSTEGTLSGQVQIQSLPFTSHSVSAAGVAFGYWDYSVPTDRDCLIGHFGGSEAVVNLYTGGVAGSPLQLTSTHITSASRFSGTITYRVA
jgi:hypothetical protein